MFGLLSPRSCFAGIIILISILSTACDEAKPAEDQRVNASGGTLDCSVFGFLGCPQSCGDRACSQEDLPSAGWNIGSLVPNAPVANYRKSEQWRASSRIISDPSDPSRLQLNVKVDALDESAPMCQVTYHIYAQVNGGGRTLVRSLEYRFAPEPLQDRELQTSVALTELNIPSLDALILTTESLRVSCLRDGRLETRGGPASSPSTLAVIDNVLLSQDNTRWTTAFRLAQGGEVERDLRGAFILDLPRGASCELAAQAYDQAGKLLSRKQLRSLEVPKTSIVTLADKDQSLTLRLSESLARETHAVDLLLGCKEPHQLFAKEYLLFAKLPYPALPE